ncbi:MAG: hypothetical protein HYZ13_15575 [Acidobacteria bacterium]|nr:hypothetical protein [Acidobacteriota bacterium]
MHPDTGRLQQLSDLTRRYAAWGREEGGLPLAWGGLTLALQVGLRVGLLFLAYALQRTHPTPMEPSSAVIHGWKGWPYFLNQVHPVVAVLLPLAWVLGKDAFRASRYQILGVVEPEFSHASIWVQRGTRLLILLAAVCIPILAALDNGGELFLRLSPFEVILGLTACWALPWLGWTRVRGWLENLVWAPMALISLLFLWTPMASRITYLGAPLVLVLLYIFLVAPAAIGLGCVQHLRFRNLRRELLTLEVS